MSKQKQLPLFPQTPAPNDVSATNTIFSGRDLGTFKDSLRTPIHRWFAYPAGYSYKFVFESFDQFDINAGDWVYDPFSGTGTTLICAKQRGINAYGVEAHAFVHWVAETKLYWGFDLALLENQLNLFLQDVRIYLRDNKTSDIWETAFPELVYKCYHGDDLKQLFHIREFIVNQISSYPLQNLLKLALTSTLRLSAAAGTG